MVLKVIKLWQNLYGYRLKYYTAWSSYVLYYLPMEAAEGVVVGIEVGVTVGRRVAKNELSAKIQINNIIYVQIELAASY